MMSALSRDRAATRTEVEQIASGLGIPCRRDEPLGPRTTMGVGGPTPALLLPGTAEALAALVRALRGAGVRFRVLGAGSNIIVDDAGIADPVISTEALPSGPEQRGTSVWAGAGLLLPRLVREMAPAGIGGFEFLEGIPGTVGGALAMNAGAGGRWIGDVVLSVEAVAPDGTTVAHKPAPGDFGYRRSFVAQQGLLVTGAVLQGAPGDPEQIRERIRDNRAYRVATQPLSERSSGCIFRNPEGDSAGALLDRLALKGAAEGGAVLSERHANFIVNRGGSSADIRRLIGRLRAAVQAQAGVDLHLEVIVWSDTDSSHGSAA